ncbi:MAG: SDR family oxidoreductase [Woeseiaceae bacterium]
MRSRREFLALSMGATAAGLLATQHSFGQSRKSDGLKILVLGGTGFIGPHFVSHAMARGHEVTLFNRGRTNTHLFPDAEKLVGDRNSDLTALEGRQWDAVLDNSGYTPLQVRQSVDLLRNACDQYLFTSTRAVYTDFTAQVMDEDAPVGPKDLPESEWSGYGPNKVLAERIVQDGFGARTLIARPPVIVGPGDRTDRFTYWVDRLDDGGDVLVQGDPTDPIQFVDVRDLAEFYVHLLENSTTGIYNTEGPASALDTAGLVHGVRAVTASPSTLHWVPWDFLIAQGETPQDSLAFWQPPRGRYLNYGRMVNRRAVQKGMRFRPLAVTAKDTLDWHRTRPGDAQQTLRAGLTRDRERYLLELYADL